MSTRLEIVFNDAGSNPLTFAAGLTSDQVELQLKALACHRVDLLSFAIDLAGVAAGKERLAQLDTESCAFSLKIEMRDRLGHFDLEVRADTDAGSIVVVKRIETADVDALLSTLRGALGGQEDTRAGAMMVYRVDGARISDWAGLHDEMARAFGFSHHYGRNLDALRDLARGTRGRLIWSRADAARAALGGGFDEVLKLLRESAPGLEIELT